QISTLTAQVRELDRCIDAMLKRHPAARRLTQITGVGALTALAYVLTIEDPARIVRSRSAGAFFGLVPGSADSGEKHEPMKITKEGDGFCRRLLVMLLTTSSGTSVRTRICVGTVRPSPRAAERTR